MNRLVASAGITRRREAARRAASDVLANIFPKESKRFFVAAKRAQMHPQESARVPSPAEKQCALQKME